uniref:Uncharacterized protein n=1 Tax=Opuntia streptacantha TaxID=393608 RepID=A0A7C9EI76_OPUST
MNQPPNPLIWPLPFPAIYPLTPFLSPHPSHLMVASNTLNETPPTFHGVLKLWICDDDAQSSDITVLYVTESNSCSFLYLLAKFLDFIRSDIIFPYLVRSTPYRRIYGVFLGWIGCFEAWWWPTVFV